MSNSMKRSSVMGTRRAVRVSLGDLLFRGFLVIGVLVAVLLWYFMSASSPYYHKSEYWIQYRDVSGLKAGDQVLVNGLQIGTVRKIVLNKDAGVLWVQISIPEDLKIPRNTEAGIYVRSLVGEKALDLRMNRSSHDYLNPGDTLAGVQTIDPTQLMAYFYTLAAEGQKSLGLIQNLNHWIDSSQIPSKGDSLVQGLVQTSRRVQGTLKVLQSGLSQSGRELSVAADTVQALKAFLQGHPAWSNLELLGSDLQTLKTQLIALKQRDEQLWKNSQPREQLSKEELHIQIRQTVLHLDSLYSILRQSKLELNPEIF